MVRNVTLEHWLDDGWYVGRLKEVSGVFSQSETLETLQNNIRDAYHLMMEETAVVQHSDTRITEMGGEV